MKTVCESLLSQKADPGVLSPDELAIINLTLASIYTVLEKISVQVGLLANWNLELNNERYPLDNIKLEIGYTDSKGAMVFRNSARVMNGENAGAITPLIWNYSNHQQIFQADFSKGVSENITVNYKIFFKLSDSLPSGFKDYFKGSKTFGIHKKEKDYWIKFYLQ